MKCKIYITSGKEEGFKKAIESFSNVINNWDTSDIEVITVTSVSEEYLYEIAKMYNNGYKIITMGKVINNLIAGINGVDQIDQATLRRKDKKTLLETTYLNKNPIKVKLGNSISFEVLPMVHPLFTVSGKNQSNVGRYIRKIRNYIGFQPTEITKDIRCAMTYKELESFILPYFNNQNLNEIEFSYDIESNYKSNLAPDFDIVGFSISFDGNSGIYALLNSFDRSFSVNEKKKAFDLLKWILEHPKSKISVHNMNYELPSTLNKLGYEIPLDKLNDTMVWSKLINSGLIGGNSLKDQASYKLGYGDWDTDLVEFRNALLNHKKLISKVNRKGIMSDIDNTDNQYITIMSNILDKYYENTITILNSYIKDIKNIVLGMKSDTTESYGYLPSKLLSRYGAIDAIATKDLLNYYRNQAKIISKKLNIDLLIGYRLWLESQYASYKLELNSIRWDEEQAKLYEKNYIKIMEEDLRYLLRIANSESKNGKIMYDHIKSNISNKIYSDFLSKDGSMQEYIENTPKFMGYTNTGKLRYKGKKIVKNKVTGKVEEVEKILNIAPNKPEEIINIFNSVPKQVLNAHVRQYLDNLIEVGINNMHYDELILMYNPNTIEGKKVMMELLYTDTVAAGKFILDTSVMITNETHQIDVANKRFNQGELELFELIATYNKNSSFTTKKDLFKNIMNKLENIRIGSKLAKYLIDAGDWRMSTLDEANMTELYEYHLVTGRDVDNDWNDNDEFTFLIHLRRYKKIYKLWTTYINGSKLGRSQVYVVNKDKFQSGCKFVPRLRKYKPGEELKPNEDLIFQGTWKPNSVLSGRWSSGIHTIPSFSDPKKFLNSRFKGGCSIISDFSQAELRVVARASKENNLLDAYAHGADVHMNTAVGIFQKPATEVSEIERRYAKMSTFRILYGGSPEGLAKTALNGDIDLANKIYDGFFTSYPKLQGWMNERHEEIKKYGLVTTMTNRYIKLGYESPGNDMARILRQSGNAPIQGPSSDIAASALYNMINFIEEKKLKSKSYCFIHDSIENDIHPADLFYMLEVIEDQMNNYPNSRFNVPSNADLLIGVSLGEENEVLEYKPDKDYKGGELILKGQNDEIRRLIAKWAEFFDYIDFEYLEYKPIYHKMKELFAVKRSYSSNFGYNNAKVKVKIRLRYDKGNGCQAKYPKDNLLPASTPIQTKIITYNEYKCGNVILQLNKLDGYYIHKDKKIKINFKSEEEKINYITKYKFEKVRDIIQEVK